MRLRATFFLPTLLILFTACQLKTPNELLDSLNSPNLSSFKISGVQGRIVGDEVTVDLTVKWQYAIVPASLTPEFQSDAFRVFVDGIRQYSGVTAHNFSEPKKYRFVAADGTERSYTVRVTMTALFPIVDTSQTLCSSGANGDGAMAACPQQITGQDGDFTDTPNKRSFVGPTAHALYPTNYTTYDAFTTITWKTCLEGQTGATCSGVATSGDHAAHTANCLALNTLNGGAGYAGRTDWRLPSIIELFTIGAVHVAGSGFDTVYFPGTPGGGIWSATNNASNSAEALRFPNNSSIFLPTVKTDATLRARCVSTSLPPYTQVRTDNNDGTILDHNSNLLWTKCSITSTGALQTHASGCSNASAGARSWLTALNDCNNLSLAGRKWRLPSLNELHTVTNLSQQNPAINTTHFPNTALANYWTSTTTSVLVSAHTISFVTGLPQASESKGNNNAVRCVANSI